jgi:hypothetical protein
MPDRVSLSESTFTWSTVKYATNPENGFVSGSLHKKTIVDRTFRNPWPWSSQVDRGRKIGHRFDFLVVIVSPSPAINTLLTISGHHSSGASGHSVRELESRHRLVPATAF